MIALRWTSTWVEKCASRSGVCIASESEVIVEPELDDEADR